MKLLFFLYFLLSIFIVIFSFGFVDANLHLSSNPSFLSLLIPLSNFVHQQRQITVCITAFIFLGLFFSYMYVLIRKEKFPGHWKTFIIIIPFVLLFAYPMFSYDIFNYVLTAKVTYHYHENPYIVMPVEIANEPNLAFTRGANKVALYGPTWILATFMPWKLGMGNIWLTMIFFKLLVIAFYFLFLWMVFRVTRNVWNVLFFALNPLVITEILISGHNDIVMMTLALGGLMLMGKSGVLRPIIGFLLIVASILVKGASLVLFPLVLIWKRYHIPFFDSRNTVCMVVYWLFFIVFLLTPFREEMYPWYAVWFLAPAAMIPEGKARFIHEFSIALSIGLIFRHLPYIATGEYGGTGPIWRIVLGIIPVGMYLFWKTSRIVLSKT